MIHVFIQHHAYRSYVVSPGCIVTGKVFYHEKLYSNEELSQLVSTWQTEEQFIEAIKELNGFYALIVNKDKQLFAAVDRVRSIPLFYGRKGNDFYLSDSAEWVRRQVDNHELDPMAREEFLLTGYVTGPDTLFPDVKQLQAGEAIIVKEDNQELSVEPIRYYRYVHAYEQEKSMDQLMEEHDRVLVRVFKRLIQVADGRTIVVPLSGGYDSRLILLMLKRLGYENIITFSYGRVGNTESVISKNVAKSLEVKWEFVEYNNHLWYQWYHSAEYDEYACFAGGGTSLPHIQDWPAVWQLKICNIIPKSSIFVPGHSADLPAGSRSTSVPELYIDQTIDIEKIKNAILNYHYSLFDWINCKDIKVPLYIEKVNRTLGDIEQYPDGASAFEFWDISERQAKFIINSIRVYEFWGYDWWIPFWDFEYMRFWCNVKLNFRINQSFYKYFVDNLFYKVTGLRVDDTSRSIKKYLKRMIGLYLSPSVKSRIKSIIKSNNRVLVKEYYAHPLALWGIYSLDEYLINARKYININSALVLDYIDNIETTIKCSG